MNSTQSSDPLPGDKRACDALELAIVPRARDIGGFEVRRALPHGRRQMVGPFIFFDQMGPARFQAGQGMDVRPHPHIGLATVTYLFEGCITHRDSEGNTCDILPGAMNLMTAGRGIVHSERTPAQARRIGEGLFGIQSWVALPEAMEETAPSFQHFDAASLPLVEDTGVRVRLIAGAAFGSQSPVNTLSPWLYAEVQLEPGASIPLDADAEERAIHIAVGDVEIAADVFQAPQLLVFRPGDRITVRSERGARFMYLGGGALEGPRHIWWNFVSSRRERIEAAKEDWKTARFKTVPGETEFIPLPER